MTNQTDTNLENVLDVAIANEPKDIQELGTLIATINMEDKITMKILAEKMNEIIDRVNELEASPQASGDTVRDIKSDRPMATEDAERVLLGDLKCMSTKEAAVTMGLSYGQVYSCRKGFTFKKVYKEFREQAAIAEQEHEDNS